MVRYKPVPGPCGLDRLRAVHGAVPADAELTDDCCARLCTVGPLTDRAAGRTWLPFLVALGLATESAAGYSRLKWHGRAELADQFTERVLGACELLAAVGTDDRVSFDQLVENTSVREAVPRSGRDRARQEAVEQRVGRLLGWAEQFGLVTETDGGYVGRASDGG